MLGADAKPKTRHPNRRYCRIGVLVALTVLALVGIDLALLVRKATGASNLSIVLSPPAFASHDDGEALSLSISGLVAHNAAVAHSAELTAVDCIAESGDDEAMIIGRLDRKVTMTPSTAQLDGQMNWCAPRGLIDRTLNPHAARSCSNRTPTRSQGDCVNHTLARPTRDSVRKYRHQRRHQPYRRC